MFGIFKTGDPERGKLLNRYRKILRQDSISAADLLEAEQIRSALKLHGSLESDAVNLRRIETLTEGYAKIPAMQKAAESAVAKYRAAREKRAAELAKLDKIVNQSRRSLADAVKAANTPVLNATFAVSGSEAVNEVVAEAQASGKLPRKLQTYREGGELPDLWPDVDVIEALLAADDPHNRNISPELASKITGKPVSRYEKGEPEQQVQHRMGGHTQLGTGKVHQLGGQR